MSVTCQTLRHGHHVICGTSDGLGTIQTVTIQKWMDLHEAKLVLVRSSVTGLFVVVAVQITTGFVLVPRLSSSSHILLHCQGLLCPELTEEFQDPPRNLETRSGLFAKPNGYSAYRNWAAVCFLPHSYQLDLFHENLGNSSASHRSRQNKGFATVSGLLFITGYHAPGALLCHSMQRCMWML